MEAKKPCFFCIAGTISLAGVTLYGLARMISNHLKQKPQIPDAFKPIPFKDEELILENFEEVLKKHTARFNKSGILEEILPRQFTDEAELKKISNNFLYAKGNQDLLSLSKV